MRDLEALLSREAERAIEVAFAKADASGSTAFVVRNGNAIHVRVAMTVPGDSILYTAFPQGAPAYVA